MQMGVDEGLCHVFRVDVVVEFITARFYYSLEIFT